MPCWMPGIVSWPMSSIAANPEPRTDNRLIAEMQLVVAQLYDDGFVFIDLTGYDRAR